METAGIWVHRCHRWAQWDLDSYHQIIVALFLRLLITAISVSLWQAGTWIYWKGGSLGSPQCQLVVKFMSIIFNTHTFICTHTHAQTCYKLAYLATNVFSGSRDHTPYNLCTIGGMQLIQPLANVLYLFWLLNRLPVQHSGIVLP